MLEFQEKFAMRKEEKGTTLITGARMDTAVLMEFHRICQRSNTTASDEIRRFVQAIVQEGKLPGSGDRLVDSTLKQRISEVVDPRLAALESEVSAIRDRLEQQK
jgi:antitoxin component of RelBE/YafQ-DinJ toxin-antitoxin module